ncbi:uncharacterized protein [Dysidea avara]|uniref:uncharacterized protein isoform X3 n=1 Tax=Dysidea avara TaxID=196820 RepID=UPI003329BC9F
MSINIPSEGGSQNEGEKGDISLSSGGLQNDIALHLSNTLLQNSPAVQQVLQQCRGVDGSYNMYCVMECLVKSLKIRDCLRQTNFQVQLPKDTPVVAADIYGAKMVHQMLVQEEYFSSFQHSYYLLYQSFPPNPRMGLAVVSQNYAVPKKLETVVLQQQNCRMCNQSILNHLLIELRGDKDLVKFWDTVKTMIQFPELKDLTERYKVEHENMVCVQVVTQSDGKHYEHSGKAADAESPSECDSITVVNTGVNMLLHRRCHCRFWENESQNLYLDSSSESTMMPPGYHLMELIRNDEGVSPEQQKLKINAELDRLVDGGHISYNEMAEVCLTIQSTKDQLLSARTGLYEFDDQMTFHPSFIFSYWEQRKMKPATIAVLKKYYQLLLENLPDDYMASLEHVNQKYPSRIPSNTIEYITAPARPREVNQRILDLFIGSIMNESYPNAALEMIAILMDVTQVDSKSGCENFEDELLRALLDDKYSSEQTRSHSTTMTTTTTTTTTTEPSIPSPQSPTSNGSHDKPWSVTTPPSTPGTQPVWTENKLYSPTMPYSSEHSIMSNTHLNQLSPKTLEVIKKYYDQLWKSFPVDHMVSLKRYCGIKRLTEASIKFIAAAATSELANKRLLRMMTYSINPKQEDTLFNFCSNLEVVIGSSDMTSVIDQFRSDLVETIFEEANSSTSEPLAVSAKAQPSSFTSQPSNTESDIIPTMSAKPMNLSKCLDLVRNLMMSMPKNYKKTVKDLQHYLTNEEISDVLASPDFMTANKIIITCLLKTYGQHLSSFLSILELIKDVPALTAVINHFKKTYSLTIFAEGQLAHLTGSDKLVPTSSVETTRHQDDEPMVFTILEANQAKPELVVVLRRYYDLLLSSFPQDPGITEQRLHINSSLAPPSHPDSQSSNQLILDHYITMLALSSEKCTPSSFCMTMSIIIGNTDITDNLENDLLNALSEKEDNMTIVPLLKSSPKCSVNTQHSEIDREVSLSCFDDYYDLMLKVNTRFAKGKFLQSFKFPSGDPITGNLALQPNEIQMEVLLAFVRNSIGINGTEDFFKLVEIFCNQEPYSDIGVSLLDTYHTKGGHGMPSIHCHKFGQCLSIENLTKKLEYHHKQLLAGLQYQPPKPLPQYYVPQLVLLDRLTKAILDSSGDSIGIDVSLGSMSGCGKTTLVKALCYQKNILEYFLDGFLWIKLGTLPQDPIIKLKNIYHQLTAMAFLGNPSLLIENLKYLVTNYLQKLLVIIDDVLELDHIAAYLKVFQHCKIIVVTGNRDLFFCIPSRHSIMIEPHSLGLEMSLKLVTMQVKGFEKPAIEHITQLQRLVEAVMYWPILLSIIHYQLIMFCNKLKQSPGSALQKVMRNLQMFSDVMEYRYVVGVDLIVETSLEFLENEDIPCLNQLVMTRGINTPKNLLPHFWNVSEDVAEGCVERLISCGLVQYDEELLLTETNYSIMPCVEVHLLVGKSLMTKLYNL